MKRLEASPTVYVNTLGEFSLTIDGKTVDDRNHQSKKAWILLEYLLTFRNREASPEELIELIWKDEDLSNPNGALKTLMFRARKLLTELDYPPQQLILQQRGSYVWNKDLNTIVDADLFEDLVNKGIGDEGTSEERLDACIQALNIYKGDFLPKSSYESWVIPVSTYYHSLYQKAAHTAIHFLMEKEEYLRVTDICQKATAIEPYDEDLHYHLIYSMFKSGQQQAALEHYNHTIDMLYNEFAISPSEHLKSLYKIIRDTKHGVVTDLSVIQENLMEEAKRAGAFFCEYTVFKDIYQLESRSIERTGDSIYLCLLTLSDLKGTLLTQPFLNKGMDILRDSVRSSLRRGDVFCRYSVSQYMLLLPTATYENGEMVLKRITRNFHKTYTRRDMTVNYSLQAVTPDKRDTGTIINI